MKAVRPILIGVAFALSAASAAAPVESGRSVAFVIEGQILRDALNKWAQQAGFQLIAPTSESMGRILAPAVADTLPALVALQQLLSGSSYTYELLGERTVVIRDTGEASRRDSPELRTDAAETDSASVRDPVVDEKSDAHDRRLEVVLVSAQRRQELIREVPISIAALSGIVLDSATTQGIVEALNRVSGVATTNHHLTGATQLVVRGVSAPSFLGSGSNPIGYYLDWVPFGFIKTALAPDSSAYDMERVEVLRGPQGTLYGASAQNGVVRILTKDANPDAFELKVRTSVSVTEHGGESYRGDAAVNVPLIPEKLAVRAVIGRADLGGWIDKPIRKDANDADLRTARVKISAQPTERLSIGLSAWLSRSSYGAPSASPGGSRSPSIVEEPISSEYDVYGLKVDYDFPGFYASATAGYLDFSNASDFDYDRLLPNTILTTRIESKVLSQELNLHSKHEHSWRWSVGGIHRDVEDGMFQLRRQYSAPADQTDFSESFAVFGELTRVFFDGKVELTGGLRYFEDVVRTRENSRTTVVAASELVRMRNDFDALSPRAVLTWHWGENLTIYGSYAEGFRSGFHQAAAVVASAPQIPPVGSDTLTNYELGVKASLWEGLFAFDGAVFFIDWQDVQQSLNVNVGTPSNEVSVNAGVNGKSASGAGVEFAATLYPLKGLEIGASFSWNNLKLDADVVSSGILLFPKNERLNLSPKYTAGAFVDYSFPLGRGGLTGQFSAAANYTSRQTTRAIYGGLSVGEGDSMLISRVGFAINLSRRWTTLLFVDNVNGEKGSSYAPPYRIPEWNQRVRPRTFGAQVEYRW